jgi:hypothetical protein
MSLELNGIAYTEADMPDIYTKQELKNRLEDWLRHPAKQMFQRVFLKGVFIHDNHSTGDKYIAYYGIRAAVIDYTEQVTLIK